MQTSRDSASTLIIPPAIPDYQQSTQYQVLVNGQSCPVYDARVFFELNNPDRVVAIPFRLHRHSGSRDHRTAPITSVRVRPTARGIHPTSKGSASPSR